MIVGTPIFDHLVRELFGPPPDLASGEVRSTHPAPGAHAATPELTPCTPHGWFGAGPPQHARAEPVTQVMPTVGQGGSTDG